MIFTSKAFNKGSLAWSFCLGGWRHFQHLARDSGQWAVGKPRSFQMVTISIKIAPPHCLKRNSMENLKRIIFTWNPKLGALFRDILTLAGLHATFRENKITRNKLTTQISSFTTRFHMIYKCIWMGFWELQSSCSTWVLGCILCLDQSARFYPPI